MIGCVRKYLYVTPIVPRIVIPGARAGIRTRVSGMKTRDDGPGYTTRANDLPCHLLFITVGHPTLMLAFHFESQEGLGSVQTTCSYQFVIAIPVEQDRPLFLERMISCCSMSWYGQ